jgi:hypothetical protein
VEAEQSNNEERKTNRARRAGPRYSTEASGEGGGPAFPFVPPCLTATTQRREGAEQRRSILFKNETVFGLQILRRNKPYTMTFGVGPQNPCGLFHLAQAWVLAADVGAAGRDGKRHPIVAEAEGPALDDLVAQASASDDGRVPAGMAERGLSVLDGSSMNLDSHRGIPPSVGASSATSSPTGYLRHADDDAIVRGASSSTLHFLCHVAFLAHAGPGRIAISAMLRGVARVVRTAHNSQTTMVGLPLLAANMDSAIKEIRRVEATLRQEIREEGIATRRHFDVVAESLRDDIRIIAEGVIALDAKVETIRDAG